MTMYGQDIFLINAGKKMGSGGKVTDLQSKLVNGKTHRISVLVE